MTTTGEEIKNGGGRAPLRDFAAGAGGEDGRSGSDTGRI